MGKELLVITVLVAVAILTYSLLTQNYLTYVPVITTGTKARVVNVLRIKSAILYQNLHSPPEGLEGAIKVINELRPSLIWYARQIVGVPPVPNASVAYEIARDAGLSDYRAKLFAKWVRERAYTLRDISEEVRSVNAVYCPCILIQNFRTDFNYDPLTFKPIPKDVLKSVALDYSKWGLPYGREATQEFFRERLGIPNGAVFPDITNKFYQEYVLRKVEALKKVGVKCVWLDALFTQANIAYAITHDFNHPAVRDAYLAAYELVKRIKELGMIVGTWSNWVRYPYREVPPVDFVTRTLSRSEVANVRINYDLWAEVTKLIRCKTNATILMVFDFGPSDDTPLAIFSQKLSPKQQRELLKQMHEVAMKLGLVPTYPVHGGCMGRNAKILSYSKYRYYDALAPQFRTYNTIKELIHEDNRRR